MRRPRPAATVAGMGRDPQLSGQTVLVIGGSSGIGLETARRAHGEGADVILTARDPDRVHRVGLELEASIAAFDATDFERLGRFFDELPSIDHVLVTGPRPHELPVGGASTSRLLVATSTPISCCRCGSGWSPATAVRAGGNLLFMGCIDGGDGAVGPAFVSALTRPCRS